MSSAPEDDGRQKEALVAKTIYEELRRQGAGRSYVSGEPRPHSKTTIDGEFHLMAVARRVLTALGDGKPAKPHA